MVPRPIVGSEQSGLDEALTGMSGADADLAVQLVADVDLDVTLGPRANATVTAPALELLPWVLGRPGPYVSVWS